MSVDVRTILDTGTGLIGAVILILAALRGVQVGRKSVSRVFRRRAFWIAGVCIVDVIQAQVPEDLTIGGLPLFKLGFFFLVFVLFVFVDSTVLVTLELDFFHRNTLRWRQGRLIVYPVVFGFGAIYLFVMYLSGLPSSPAWVSAISNPALASVFQIMGGYSAVTLVIGARRTASRTLRGHITLLGFFGVIFLVSTIIFNYKSTLSIDLLSDFLHVLAPYLLYRAAMTLSPVGRLEKEMRTPKPSENVVVTPSQP